MTYDQVLKFFGGKEEWGRVTRAAAALNVPLSTLATWKRRGIPKGRQARIQIDTAGRLRVDERRPRSAARGL